MESLLRGTVHNDGIWVEKEEEVSYNLIKAPAEKFKKCIILWGGISSKSLIPSTGPINLTKWLKERNAKYLIADLYAEFIESVAYPEIEKVFKRTTPIFEDDQDNKHRSHIALKMV